jgi:hypothetical protein
MEQADAFFRKEGTDNKNWFNDGVKFHEDKKFYI